MESFIARFSYPKYKLLDSSAPGFVGRWFKKSLGENTCMVTLNDGSAFHFLTDGADSVNVDFLHVTPSTVPYFSYSIDGSDPIRQLITEPTVILPDNGMHVVCIRADGLTESVGKWDKELGFALKGVNVNRGKLVGIAPQNKVIAFFGDSITEGVNVFGVGGNSDVNSATHAYPYYCTRILKATEYNVGYGGSGICKPGSFNTFINAIDYLSEARAVDTDFRPDVIVVNHGTNDQKYTELEFESGLRKALDRLLTKYDGIPTFYMIPFSQRRAEIIRRICKEYGDGIHVIETAAWDIPLTDNLHPNVIGSENAGEQLAKSLKAILGEEFFNK